eukprot:PhM_4_TR10042/c0_g1_i1/m.99281
MREHEDPAAGFFHRAAVRQPVHEMLHVVHNGLCVLVRNVTLFFQALHNLTRAVQHRAAAHAGLQLQRCFGLVDVEVRKVPLDNVELLGGEFEQLYTSVLVDARAWERLQDVRQSETVREGHFEVLDREAPCHAGDDTQDHGVHSARPRVVGAEKEAGWVKHALDVVERERAALFDAVVCQCEHRVEGGVVNHALGMRQENGRLQNAHVGVYSKRVLVAVLQHRSLFAAVVRVHKRVECLRPHSSPAGVVQDGVGFHTRHGRAHRIACFLTHCVHNGALPSVLAAQAKSLDDRPSGDAIRHNRNDDDPGSKEQEDVPCVLVDLWVLLDHKGKGESDGAAKTGERDERNRLPRQREHHVHDGPSEGNHRGTDQAQTDVEHHEHAHVIRGDELSAVLDDVEAAHGEDNGVGEMHEHLPELVQRLRVLRRHGIASERETKTRGDERNDPREAHDVVGNVKRNVGEAKRDGDLDERFIVCMLEAVHHQGAADGTDKDSAEHKLERLHDQPAEAEREMSSMNRRHQQHVEDDCGTIVYERLTLDDAGDVLIGAELAEQRDCRDGVGGGDNGPIQDRCQHRPLWVHHELAAKPGGERVQDQTREGQEQDLLHDSPEHLRLPVKRALENKNREEDVEDEDRWQALEWDELLEGRPDDGNKPEHTAHQKHHHRVRNLFNRIALHKGTKQKRAGEEEENVRRGFGFLALFLDGFDATAFLGVVGDVLDRLVDKFANGFGQKHRCTWQCFCCFFSHPFFISFFVCFFSDKNSIKYRN